MSRRGLLLVFASPATPTDGTWAGWIADRPCGAQGARQGAGECTTNCVKEHGAKYVFVDDAVEKVHTVHALGKVADHAGHLVPVPGRRDGRMLRLASISTVK
jgi:hypothetical protein